MEIKNNKVNKQETHNFTAWVWTNQATAERRPTEPEDVFESIETFDIICTPDTVFTNAVLELLGEEAEELLDEPLTETSAKEYIENVDWSSGEAGIFAIYDNTAHKYLLGDGDEAYEWATLYQGEEDLEAYAKRIGKSFSDLIAMPESNARDTRKKSLYINERFNKEEFGKRFGVEDTELLDQFFASIDEMEANNEEDLDIDDNYNEQPADIMNEFDDNFDNEIEEPVNNEALILRTVRNKILSVDPNEQDSPELIRDIKEALSLENIEITEEEIQRYIDISLDAELEEDSFLDSYKEKDSDPSLKYDVIKENEELLNRIKAAGKESKLFAIIQNMYANPTDDDINDFLSDEDWVLTLLDLKDEE